MLGTFLLGGVIVTSSTDCLALAMVTNLNRLEMGLPVGA